ncbi:hypothetical protein HOS54_gp212 [Klebsiella phage Menlow]|uniref:Uncharacterized protein n=1 Tax=Klebsiella phage Menlow TaxID=2054273 RepID=A0A2H5BN42_9CAUD|nr:hypothetical protein HOS54_gp212 [Klebsiella phage Menlow]AUG87737.1 hypothetical protein CPT_Menlow_036 [Klebsiella phage Menlow]
MSCDQPRAARPFIPFAHDQFMRVLSSTLRQLFWMSSPCCQAHPRSLFFQGFPLTSLNQTGIRACKIGLDTTLRTLTTSTSHP